MYALRGLGATAPAKLSVYCASNWFNWFLGWECHVKPFEVWQRDALALVAAAPGAPAGSALTLPPVDGESARAEIDAIVNRQASDQQNLNAAGVDSSIPWRAASVAVGAGEAVTDLAGAAADAAKAVFSVNWGVLALVAGLGVFAIVAAGAGSPRRYGR